MNGSLLQTGIGIDARNADFHAVCLKRIGKRIRMVDRLEISRYRELSPRECGKTYREFLRRNGLKLPWTVVALPRSAFLLRRLNLPRVVQKELARAIEYQIDGLHPFESGSVYWDFALWRSLTRSQEYRLVESEPSGSTDFIDVLVALAEKSYINEVAAWFQEAGIAVSQFSPAATLLFSMMHPPLSAEAGKAPAFFLLEARPETVELVAYAPGLAPLAREIPRVVVTPEKTERTEGTEKLAAALYRQLDLARAELRLDPTQQLPVIVCGMDLPALRVPSEESSWAVSPLESLFQNGVMRLQDFPIQERAVALAAAFAAVQRKAPLAFNLLPPERRSYQSPLAYLPAYALSTLVMLLAILMGARGTMQDWLYYRYLEKESQNLRPQLEQLETAQTQSQALEEQLQLLERARSSANFPLEILSELTRLLPPDVWLQQMQYDETTLALYGYAHSASGLLQTLAASPYFESPQFTSAITSTPDGKEIFRIGVRLRAPSR